MPNVTSMSWLQRLFRRGGGDAVPPEGERRTGADRRSGDDRRSSLGAPPASEERRSGADRRSGTERRAT